MWLAGAVGLSSGFGLWQIAGLGTALILIVMSLLQTLERRLGLASRKQPAPEKEAASDRRVGKDDPDPEC